MTERDFQAQVVQLLRLTGFRVQYVTDSRRSPEGWPDLAFWKDDVRLRHAELKTEKGRLSPKQRDTIASLRAAGQTVYVWRPTPECWREIEAVAQARRAA